MKRRWLMGLFIGALGAVYWLNAPPRGGRDGVLVVDRGAPASRIAADLRAGGWIRSQGWARVVLLVTRSERRLKAGAYRLRAGSTTSALLRDIVQGRTATQRVTIPEGWASWQIGERLQELGVCPSEDFRRGVAEIAAEGTLFPETYFFDGGTPAAMVRDAMRARFAVVWSEVVAEAQASGAVISAEGERVTLRRPGRAAGRTFQRNDLVTLASIVEREARLPTERTAIAAVYHNRLAKRLRLEADPTVQFALGQWKDRLTYADLKNPSPYNTYRHEGLPPGPICNPGRASLAAALAPVVTDALFFVADGAGGHHFSARYAEHLRWVRARRRARDLKKSAAPLH
jgi:UPF0755 protein